MNRIQFILPSGLGGFVGQGCEADVYAFGESMVFRAERVPRNGTIERTLSALEAARNGGIPVPRMANSATIAGRPGIVMERLEPGNLLQHIARFPWQVQTAGHFMGWVHAEIHRISGPMDLPSLEEMSFMVARTKFNKFPRTRLKHGRLLHGDFTPANLLRNPLSRRWVVVDWGGAASGDPEADVALTLVAIRAGAPPLSAFPLVRSLAPFGRHLLASSYLREYLRNGRLDCDTVLQWALFWRYLRQVDSSSFSRIPEKSSEQER